MIKSLLSRFKNLQTVFKGAMDRVDDPGLHMSHIARAHSSHACIDPYTPAATGISEFSTRSTAQQHSMQAAGRHTRLMRGPAAQPLHNAASPPQSRLWNISCGTALRDAHPQRQLINSRKCLATKASTLPHYAELPLDKASYLRCEERRNMLACLQNF